MLKVSSKLSSVGNEENRPPVVDYRRLHLSQTRIRPCILVAKLNWRSIKSRTSSRYGVTYGTSLKLVGVQLVSLQSGAGVDTGDMAAEDVAALFGKTEGYKATDPTVTVIPEDMSDDF